MGVVCSQCAMVDGSIDIDIYICEMYWLVFRQTRRSFLFSLLLVFGPLRVQLWLLLSNVLSIPKRSSSTRTKSEITKKSASIYR